MYSLVGVNFSMLEEPDSDWNYRTGQWRTKCRV